MIREPLSPSDTPPTTPTLTNSALPIMWVAIGLAALFLILAIYHAFLTLNTKGWFTWTFVAASIVQCISLIANAYDIRQPASTAWYALEGVVFPLAPTLIMIACVQTFGRAAWHSLLSNHHHLARLRGFLRWNTSVFIAFMIFSYILMLIGNMMVVAMAPDAVVYNGDHAARVKAAYGTVEAGLILQMLFLVTFMLLAWRWKSVSRDWDIEWDAVRRSRWTWKALLRIVLAGTGLLVLRQVYILIRFFSTSWGVRWLHFVFDILPLLASLILLAIWHPGRCLPGELTSIRFNSSQLASEHVADTLNSSGTPIGSESNTGKQSGSETDSEKQ